MNTNKIPAAVVEPKSGDEAFVVSDKKLEITLKDFWSWSQSDLLSNALRGVIAEFIVRQDVGAKERVRVEWDTYDLETHDGYKIEVKSSAYLQTWEQAKHSHITFDIGLKKNRTERDSSNLLDKIRPSDIYVFCLLHHKEMETINPLKLEQWTFYVLPTSILNTQLKAQKTIRLSSLLKLKPAICAYGEIHGVINSLIST
jgi:hypothetical protein